MFISFRRILNNLFSVCWKKTGTILECIVLTSGSELWQKTSIQHDSQTTWMPTRWEIISCEEYGTCYHLFIRPTIEPLVNDNSQIEVMKHSRLLILYYTDSSAICVSLSLSQETWHYWQRNGLHILPHAVNDAWKPSTAALAMAKNQWQPLTVMIHLHAVWCHVVGNHERKQNVTQFVCWGWWCVCVSELSAICVME